MYYSSYNAYKAACEATSNYNSRLRAANIAHEVRLAQIRNDAQRRYDEAVETASAITNAAAVVTTVAAAALVGYAIYKVCKD